jgi:hypothetical protein
VWNGPFYVGKLTRPVSLGDALMKVLETVWRGAILFAIVIAAIVAAAVGADAINDANLGEPRLSELEPSITAYTKPCDDAMPLGVQVMNHSNRTVQHVTLRLEARRAGRSTDLVSYLGRDLQMDNIIPPGEGYGYCWTLPELTGLEAGENPRSLVWSVKVADATWAAP